MKKFAVTVLLLSVSAAYAQFVPSASASAPVSISPISAMPAGKIYTDPTTLTGSFPGKSGVSYGVVCTGNYATCFASDEGVIPARAVLDPPRATGAFRIGCKYSHMAYDDPIVYPGQAGKTHLHAFFGNVRTRSVSDLEHMADIGDSTCSGGTLNRTGYWVPPFVYHCPAGSVDGCNRSLDGKVYKPEGGNFYYKQVYGYDANVAGYGGTPLRWWPKGFRMIVGHPNATTQPGAELNYALYTQDGQEIWHGRHIPTPTDLVGTTGVPWELKISMSAPVCIDRTQLDSPDHKSHTNMNEVPYLENFYTGCQDPRWPDLTPEVGINIVAIIPPEELPFVRLSSDPPKSSGQPAGWTIHFDWVNGWDETKRAEWGNKSITDVVIEQCYGVGLFPPVYNDCHNNVLGNPDPANPNKWWMIF